MTQNSQNVLLSMRIRGQFPSSTPVSNFFISMSIFLEGVELYVDHPFNSMLKKWFGKWSV